jgi:glyceraldehyde-3-phosphate dehydrogenase/erythrose-4-phosphate dehydrogenase
VSALPAAPVSLEVVAWYDHEWGYSVRVAALVHYIALKK